MPPVRQVFIPFGELLPDRKSFLDDGLIEASGVVLAHGTYIAAPSLQLRSANIPTGEVPLALWVHPRGYGDYRIYMGVGAKLYEFNPSSIPWTRADVTRSVGGAYSAASPAGWSPTSFGDHVIFANGVDETQILLSGGSAFEDMITSTFEPRGKVVFPIRGNLFQANCNVPVTYDGLATGAHPQLVAWSMSNNARLYGTPTVDPSYIGAGYQELDNDFGHVVGGIGGESGILFQDRGIVRIDGPPYEFRTVSQGFGTRFPKSIVMAGYDCYFWGESGPARLVGGEGPVENIANGKVSRTLTDNMTGFSAQAIISGIDPLNVSAAVVPRNELVVWTVTTDARATNGDSDHLGDLLVVYSIRDEAFTFCPVYEYENDVVASADRQGALFLATAPPAGEAWSPFSRIVCVRQSFLIADPAVYGVGEFLVDGIRPTPTFTKGYQALVDGYSTRVRRVRPVYEMSGGEDLAVTLTLNSINQTWASPTTLDFTTLDSHGWITTPEAVMADFHSYRLQFATSNTQATVHARPSECVAFKGIIVEFETGSPFSV